LIGPPLFVLPHAVAAFTDAVELAGINVGDGLAFRGGHFDLAALRLMAAKANFSAM
jgi:hypothetical protein